MAGCSMSACVIGQKNTAGTSCGGKRNAVAGLQSLLVVESVNSRLSLQAVWAMTQLSVTGGCAAQGEEQYRPIGAAVREQRSEEKQPKRPARLVLLCGPLILLINPERLRPPPPAGAAHGLHRHLNDNEDGHGTAEQREGVGGDEAEVARGVQPAEDGGAGGGGEEGGRAERGQEAAERRDGPAAPFGGGGGYGVTGGRAAAPAPAPSQARPGTAAGRIVECMQPGRPGREEHVEAAYCDSVEQPWQIRGGCPYLEGESPEPCGGEEPGKQTRGRKHAESGRNEPEGDDERWMRVKVWGAKLSRRERVEAESEGERRGGAP